MLTKPSASALLLLSILNADPTYAVTHDEQRDGVHNTFLVRNGPTGSNFDFFLDPGLNLFTGASDCASIPRPDYVRCGEMFDLQFPSDHHISSFRLWLWDEFEEFFPFQPTGSTSPFFTVSLVSTPFSNTNFFAGESFTRDEAFGAGVRGEKLFETQMPVGVQYFEVGIDHPDGTFTIERWPSTALTVHYDSPQAINYRMEIQLSPVPELDARAAPLTAAFLIGLYAWRRERHRVADCLAGC